MSCEPQYTRIQLRRDIASDWQLNNPVLASGEAGYETNTGKLKIGNGTTAWNLLPYFDDRTANWTDLQGRPVNLSEFNNDVGYLTLATLPDPYVLPTASTTVLGGVKLDGTTITINGSGVISALAPNLLGDLTVNNTTVSTATDNVPITFETHNGATVYNWTLGNDGMTTLPDGLTLPVSTLTESIASAEVIIEDLTLDVVVDYSTGPGDFLPQNTYGTHNQINAPWAVYRFTTTPSPVLELEDVVAGDAVPVGSTVVVVGEGINDRIVVTNLTFVGPVSPPAAVISVARPITNAALAISTNPNTDISLIAGVGGRVLTSSHVIPLTNDTYDLGSPTRRFRRLWLGGGSVYVQDETTGGDVRITAIDGNLVIAGAAGLEVGEFRFVDNELTIIDPARDIQIGKVSATGAINFRRRINVRNSTDEYNLFQVNPQGEVTILSDIATDPTNSAVSIVGARTRDVQSPANLGVLLQLTGSSTAPSRIYHDSYGAANYSAFIGRKARGDSLTPSQVLANDIISRIGANPYKELAFSDISTMRMDFVAKEDQTNSAQGNEIQFWSTAIGSSTIGKRVSIDSTGIVLTALGSGGITFADSTRQTTAWTGTVSTDDITGLSLVATTNNYSDLTGLPTLFSGAYDDLTGKPNVVTSVAVTSGLTVGRVGGTVTLGNSGVLSVAAAVGTGQITVGTVGGAVTLTLPQGIATTSDLTFHDLTITGTLTATNFNVETAPTIAGKILYLAADALVAADIDGGGIWLGPVADAYSRSFLYNLANNRWDTDGAGLKTLQLDSTDIFVTGHGHFGNAYNDYNFPNAAVQTDGNTDSYLQIVTKNHSDGVSASSDYVATNDIGDDTAHYIDMGIVSSNYTDALWPILAANDGYVYINGGSLRIGTDTATKDIKFFTGGTLVENVRATISDTGLTVVGTTSSTLFSGPLTGDVTGNVSGNAGTVTNGVYTSDTGTVTNLMLAGSIANNKLTNSSVTVNGTTISLGGSGTVTAAASTLTGTTLASNVLASSLTSVGTLTNLTVTNPITGSVTGNAGTVTNGVYTNGSYANPTWITSLAYSKLTGAPTILTLVSQLTNDSGYVTATALAGYATQVYVNSQGFLTGITSLQVTTALGYTPVQSAVTSAVAGAGIGVSSLTGAVTFTNTGVTSIVAGSGISISGATGAVTINATAGSQNAIQTISVQGDGSYTATSPTSSVIFAPAGRMSLNIVGNVISITDNAKAHKVKKVKHKDLTFETDLEATSAEDTMTFIDGRGIRMTTNAVNQTITIAAEDTIRDAGATNAVTIDFAVDEVVLYQPTNTNAITLTNMSVGKRVIVYAKCSTNKVITHGALATSASLGAATITPVAGSLVKIEYFCTGSTQASVYATWTK